MNKQQSLHVSKRRAGAKRLDGNPFGQNMSNKDKQNFLKFVSALLQVDVESLVEYWIKVFHRWESKEGTLNAVRRMKDGYNVSLRYAANIDFKPMAFIKSDGENYPKFLKDFKPFLRGTLDEKRAGLTVLQLFKLINTKGQYTLDSISKPYSGTNIEDLRWLDTFDSVVRENFPKSQLEDRIKSLRPTIYVSNKSGPNGPSIPSVLADFAAIRNTQILDSIVQLAELTDNTKLIDIVNGLLKEPVTEVVSKLGKVLANSRIRTKYEPGGKVRLFCIGDWFTQTALKPIHTFMMDWLKSNACDGTKNHGDASEEVRMWTSDRSNKGSMWSFDLTTATDRFPVLLQVRVVRQMFGNAIANEWLELVTNREFVGPNGENVRFGAGQPMGFLSSWATFAITHHMLIQTASKVCGHKHPFTDYRIIGDDITMCKDWCVALQYNKMMTIDLGVPISEDKSVDPLQYEEVDAIAELAKRVFYNGYEITPIPPTNIIEGMRSPIGKRNLLDVAARRGYGRATNPFSVQSILTSKDYATVCYPIRSVLPLTGLRTWTSFRETHNLDNGGIHPFWSTWFELSNYRIEDESVAYLEVKIRSAMRKAIGMLSSFQNPSLLDEPSWGGDWNPSQPTRIQNFLNAEIASYIIEQLKESLDVTQDNSGLLTQKDSLTFIGSLHNYLEPDLLFKGERDNKDEKTKTMVFVSNLIKHLFLKLNPKPISFSQDL